MKKQTVKSIRETIENYPVDRIQEIIQSDQRSGAAMATLAAVLTAGSYEHKTVRSAFLAKAKEYCKLLQSQVQTVIDADAGDDAVKHSIKGAAAELHHFQKAVNRALESSGSKRSIESSERLVFKHGKLANSKRHLFGTKKLELVKRGKPEQPSEKPEQEKPDHREGSCSVAQEIRDEAQERELSIGRQIAAVSDLIESLKQQGDVHALSNIATQCLTAIETLQQEKPVKQAASNKRAFTTALKLMKSYRSSASAH